MKKILFLLLFAIGEVLAQTSPVRSSQSTSTSATVLTFKNPGGAIAITVEEIFTGSPATVSVVIQGCMRGNTCDTLDTNTNTSGGNRPSTLPSKAYDTYTVTPSWTGGTNVTFTANLLSTTASNNVAVPTGACGGDLSGTYPNCTVSRVNGGVIPGAAPSAAQILLGNAGGTAYAASSVTGDCTIASTGVLTCSQINGSNLTVNSSGQVTKYGGVSTVGNGACVPIARVAPTDYSSTSSITTTPLFTTGAAEGQYRITFFGVMKVAGSAGTYQPGFNFTTQGHNLTLNVASTIASTPQWTTITGNTTITFFADSATVISYLLTASGVTGSPTIRYTFLLEQCQ